MMKKLILLLAVLPMFFSCDFGLDFDMKLSPTIAGASYVVEKPVLGDADAEKALEAVIISGTDWDGKKGETRNFQVQLMGSKYGGEPDKLEIYYYLDGTVSFLSNSSCTIKMKKGFHQIEDTYSFTRYEKDDKRYVELKGSSKSMTLRFWHLTD